MILFDFKLNRLSFLGCEVYNLGTGKGTSVLEMVAAFEKASGKVFGFWNNFSSVDIRCLNLVAVCFIHLD